MKISRSRTPPTTPLKAIISAHGNVTMPEYPDRIDETSRKGWGATFWGKESTTNWFHIPFSAPALLDGSKPLFSRAFLFFHNTSRSPVIAVHLYDGPKLLRAFDNLALFGDHVAGATQANTFNLKKPVELHYGLGISVNVSFPRDTGEKPPRWILFTSALAEFRS
ncbi:MAG TPA: hypothetical protein DCQ83_08935 [Fibrobacteres bacterium]|nr:hypothetical protein [Fibrobacterota bacterium]